MFTHAFFALWCSECRAIINCFDGIVNNFNYKLVIVVLVVALFSVWW